jgi:hypothetical protein
VVVVAGTPLMEVESTPLGPDVATRFGRAVTHDNGGVFYSPAFSLSSERTVRARCAHLSLSDKLGLLDQGAVNSHPKLFRCLRTHVSIMRHSPPESRIPPSGSSIRSVMSGGAGTGRKGPRMVQLR